MPRESPQAPAWHALGTSTVLNLLGADQDGLSAADAAERLARHGPNAIPQRPPPAWWHVLIRQLRSPIIYILAVAAVVSAAIGHLTDAGFIAAVVAVNTFIGAVQEQRAERSARALRQLLRARAFVQRDRQITEVDAETVVPGDVVTLESGYRVPADARLLTAHGLEVDESLLTGESLAVLKDGGWVGDEQTVVGDRRNMVFAGSIVTRGRAKAVTVATGPRTQVGRLAIDIMGGTPGRPPLMVRMTRFTRAVSAAVLVAALVIAVLGVLIGGRTATEMFLFGVALAVSAIPEGLPVAITVALAVASTRMSRRNVIVRRLHAVEGLGSCTLIASDKTGTLTCNELTVTRIRLADGRAFDVSGGGFAPTGEVLDGRRALTAAEVPDLAALCTAAVACNEADLYHQDGEWGWRGDPTDVALLAMAAKAGVWRDAALDRLPQINQIPFEPEHRFAATFHADGETARVFVKGAPERVLAMCGGSSNAASIGRARAIADEMATRGFRVLALASGTLDEPLDPETAPEPPTGLDLLGFVGMIDPLRPGVREAVAACRGAGVNVCMVTGDHPVTALAIASDLGFARGPDEVVRGDEIADLSGVALDERIGGARVFARVAPHQKLDIVRAAQRAGHFVAVTGDGVNDAPALRAANIGVAMGRAGTDVAREAADMVITDDNFATIVAGIEEGRIAFDNIRKVIYLLVATGAAEVVLVALSVATASPLPLLPAQILWLNLVTNGIQDVALAFEPGEGDALRRPPRPPKQRIFDRVMIENTIYAALLMGVAGFVAFRWMLNLGWTEAEARNGLLLLMVLFENVHIGNCRSETKSALRLSPLKSPILLVGAIAAFLVHVTMMHLPIGARILGTEPVSPRAWIVFGIVALGLFWLVELHKFRWRRRHRPA